MLLATANQSALFQHIEAMLSLNLFIILASCFLKLTVLIKKSSPREEFFGCHVTDVFITVFLLMALLLSSSVLLLSVLLVWS